MYENLDETEQTWQTRKQNKHGNEYRSLINNHFVTRDIWQILQSPKTKLDATKIRLPAS